MAALLSPAEQEIYNGHDLPLTLFGSLGWDSDCPVLIRRSSTLTTLAQSGIKPNGGTHSRSSSLRLEESEHLLDRFRHLLK